MSSRNVIVLTVMLLTGACISTGILTTAAGAPEPSAQKQPEAGQAKDQNGTPAQLNVARAAREEKALQDARRQQLAEREAQLAAKEQELKKLSSKLESQLKSLEENRKRMDESLKTQAAVQKKAQDEKTLKMVKLFKTMRAEQAGKLIDSLNEDQVISLLSRFDNKTVVKLIPFISQPRVLKWITGNLPAS